jgi:hypothetical protein
MKKQEKGMQYVQKETTVGKNLSNNRLKYHEIPYKAEK